MRLSQRTKLFVNTYLAVSLAFFFPLAAATIAYAAPTPAQQVTQLREDFNYYTQRYSTYVGHYQQYAPNRMSELDAFASSLTTFSSTVVAAESALQGLYTASAELQVAQANVAAVPGQISTSEQALNVAQQNYDAASTSLQALTPSYSQALQERNDAYAAYQATVTGGTITETFDNATVNTSIQFLLNGSSITGGTNPRVTFYSYSTNVTGGAIFFDSNSTPLQIVSPSGASQVSFYSAAKNGAEQVLVTYTDSTTGTFTNPNGVPDCTNYECFVSFTAPQGKQIQSITFPNSGYDIWLLDRISFVTSTYDPTAYQNYQDKQAALEALAPAYNAASATLATATQTLASAQATYNTYSNPTYLTNLEAIRDGKEEAASTASAALATAINAATVARQVTIDAYSAIVLPPTSLEVTSTADSATAATEPGTLRWAITQANATAGGIYDLITIKTTEPITLSANLPIITQNVTITGLSTNAQIIDGAGQFTAFDVRNQSITINLGNMTIQNTYASDWQRGSALWVVRGTANVTDVHFTNISQGTAVTTKEGGSYINIFNSRFSKNNQGLFSNHGSTPSTTTADDTPYNNRISVTNTVFHNNQVAIYGERTIVVDTSTFTNNVYGFRMQGINKHRVTNSTFDGNQVAIYSNSWIPTSWTTFFSNPPQGRVIHNNIFRNNAQRVIELNDYMTDGKANQQGASIQGNSWDGKGNIFVQYSQYSATQSGNVGYNILSVDDIAVHPFNFSGNIDIAPRIDTPTNVQAVVNQDGSVTVTWVAPTAYNTTIERYTIAWSDTEFTTSGWGWNHDQTSVTIPADVFETTTGLGEDVQFRVRADNNTAQVYSQYTTTVEVSLPAPAPVVTPEPTPTPTTQPEPTPTPEPTPSPAPSPEPSPSQPEPTPTPTPTPEPSPEPTTTPDPEPTPTIPPTETPEPTPTPEPEPTEEPTTPVDPEPTPSPEPTEEPTLEPEPSKPEEPTTPEEPSTPEEPITSPEDLPEEITPEVLMQVDLEEIVPTELTEAQAEALKEAALETFETAEPGSPEYEQALDALLVAAQQDDIVVGEELAAVPVVGAAVVALVDAFNALGNAGADMSPQVREQSEKVVIAAVIVGQVAMTATAAATSAAAAAARRP
jgi:hypothetical protein